MASVQVITKKVPQSAVVKLIGPEDYVVDQGVIPAGATANGSATFDIGVVLGRITSGAITVGAPAAGGGNSGNGTCTLGTPAYDDQVQSGTYRAVALSALEWEVFDPSGKLVGIAADGVAFTDQVRLTITHGGAGFVAGDSFTVAVSATAGIGAFVQLNPDAADGSQDFAGIVYRGFTVDASSDTPATILARGPAIVISDNLIWPVGISAAAQGAALARAAAVGIKAQPFG